MRLRARREHRARCVRGHLRFFPHVFPFVIRIIAIIIIFRAPGPLLSPPPSSTSPSYSTRSRFRIERRIAASTLRLVDSSLNHRG